MAGKHCSSGMQKISRVSRNATMNTLDSPEPTCTQAKLTQYFKPLNSSVSLRNLTNAVLLVSFTGKSPSNGKKRKSQELVIQNDKKEKKSYQPVIDADQRIIGPQVCAECGVCFDHDDEKDRKLHDIQHARLIREKVEGESCDFDYTVVESEILITAPNLAEGLKLVAINIRTATCSLIKKTQAMLHAVERQINAMDDRYLSAQTDLVLLLVDLCGKKVVACLAAEKISHDKTTVVRPCESSTTDGASISAVSKKAFCGIYLIWVSPQHRRRGTATVLIDRLRRNYLRICYQNGEALDKANVAFSDPTSHGTAFIRAYMGEEDCRTYFHNQRQ